MRWAAARRTRSIVSSRATSPAYSTASSDELHATVVTCDWRPDPEALTAISWLRGLPRHGLRRRRREDGVRNAPAVLPVAFESMLWIQATPLSSVATGPGRCRSGVSGSPPRGGL